MTTLEDFTVAAFEAVKPGTKQADQLGWALEGVLLPYITDRGVAGLEEAVGALNALGHELRREHPHGTIHRFNELLSSGRARLEITGFIGADVLSIAVGLKLVEEPILTPEQAQAEERRAEFYHRFARVGGHGPDEYARLPDDDRVIYCIGSLEADVNNGGFDQYFGNTEGRLAEDTLHALYAIGANEIAGLLDQAMACFPAPPGKNRDAWMTRFDSLSRRHRKTLAQLDDRFYAARDDLSVLAWEFLNGSP